MTGLQPNTTYYIRAYAKNAYGVSFSSVAKKVKTQLVCGQNLTDHRGNVYETIIIAGKCWTKQNMRCNYYDDVLDWTATGTHITTVSSDTGYMSTTTRYAYYPNNNSSNVSSYGLLYNWPAATGYGLGSSSSTVVGANTVTAKGVTQGICPRGWHVPTRDEFTLVSSNYPNYYEAFINSPAGKRLIYFYVEFGNFLYLWSSEEDSYYNNYAWAYDFYYNDSHSCHNSYHDKSDGYSVRCVKD